MATGDAGMHGAWPNLSREISKVVEAQEYAPYHISFHIYMVGETELNASPTIVFCSGNVAARRKIRKEVRRRGFLKDYPTISLGDASSPLIPNQGVVKRSTLVPPNGVTKPTPAPLAFGATRGDNTAGDANVNRPGMSPSNESIVDPMSHLNFDTLSVKSDCDTSTIGTNSTHSSANRSCRISVASSATTRSSLQQDYEEVTSDTSGTVKGIGHEDSDMQSSPDEEFLEDSTDSSEGKPPNPDEDPFKQQRPDIVAKLLRMFFSNRGHATATGNVQMQRTCRGGSPEPVLTGKEVAATPSASAPRSRKRPAHRKEDELSEDEDEDDSRAPKPAKRSRRGGQKAKLFACPYWKKDPLTFCTCHHYQLRLIKDVKLHLRRVHPNPIRCDICQDIFDTDEMRSDHVREQACSKRPRVKDNGVSPGQIARLNKRAPHGYSKEQQWFVVWKILFDPIIQPESPYRDGPLSRDLCEFQAFYWKNGSAAIMDCFRKHEGWTDADEQRFTELQMDAVLRDGLQEIHRRFVADRQKSEPQGELEPGGEPSIAMETPSPVASAAEPAPGSQAETQASHANNSNERAENVDESPLIGPSPYGYGIRNDDQGWTPDYQQQGIHATPVHGLDSQGFQQPFTDGTSGFEPLPQGAQLPWSPNSALFENWPPPGSSM